MTAIPPGYAPFHRTSPFLDLVGPLYERTDDLGFSLGVLIETRHCNRRGLAHGGLLMTLADLILGYSCVRAADPGLSFTTISMSTDFVAPARLDDFIEARADVQKVGGSLAFANCYMTVGETRLVRASGTFRVGRAAERGT